MTTRLFILNGSGDMKITWDHSDPAECEKARATVAELRDQGYLFFLVDGTPADEVAAGGGALVVRKMAADEVAAPIPEPLPDLAEAEVSPAPSPKRRGRPPKVKAADAGPTVVAVRPVRGG